MSPKRPKSGFVPFFGQILQGAGKVRTAVEDRVRERVNSKPAPKAPTPVYGSCSARFQQVKQVFQENFDALDEVGASFCVFHRGQPVVNLWGGKQQPVSQTGAKPTDLWLPWEEESATITFSTTKGIMAMAMLMLNLRGDFDYDAPVSEYWPEFAAGGKDSVTVRTLMNHRAGLPAVKRAMSLDDVARWNVSDALSAQRPIWAPDTAQGYHAVSFGLYVGELFQRISGGQQLNQFVAKEIAGPLGAQLRLGTSADPESPSQAPYPCTEVARLCRPNARQYLSEGVSAVIQKETERQIFFSFFKKSSVTSRAINNPAELGIRGLHRFNLPEVQKMQLPWAGLIASAKGLAQAYNVLAVGGSLEGKNGKVHFCEPQTLEALMTRQSFERDLVLHKEIGFSQGFMKEDVDVWGAPKTSFGHPGTGGSVGWCDPENQLAIGYVMNRMDPRYRSPRATRLVHAVYRCLG